MTDDTMPPQPKTVELPKVSAPGGPPSSGPEKLTVEDKIDRIEANVADLSANMNVFVDELRSTNKRLADAEEWRARFENRVSSYSRRAAAIVDKTSQADLLIESKLAQEINAREAVAKKLEDAVVKLEAIGASNAEQDKKIDAILTIGSKLDKLTERPAVKFFGGMLLFTLLQAIAMHYGVHLPLPPVAP